MKLSEKIKKAIEAEFNQWVEFQYAGKDKKDRQQHGQFFTPPPLTIKMLEKFDSIKNKTILDPTLGAGGLIAAAIIAGANPKMCYGIELDPEILAIAKKRLCPLGVPEKNLKLGNALDSDAYNFDEPEQELHDQNALYFELVKVDNSVDFIGDILVFPDIVKKHIKLNIINKSKINTKNLEKLHLLFNRLNNLYTIISKNKPETSNLFLNKLFNKIKLDDIIFNK